MELYPVIGNKLIKQNYTTNSEQMIYTRRRALDSRTKYTKEFLDSLVSSLQGCGFTIFNIKLPHNIVGTANCEISYKELITRERNYPSLIFVAKNEEKNEVVKILFVNKSMQASFFDDTFPSGDSEPPELYISTQDPARTYALFEYYYEYLKKPSITNFIFLGAISLFCGILIWFEVIALMSSGLTAFHARWKIPWGWDVLIVFVSMVFIFKFYAYPKGLWIKPKRKIHLLRLFNMALRGNVRDNPLAQLIITILGTILTTFIMKILGII